MNPLAVNGTARQLNEMRDLPSPFIKPNRFAGIRTVGTHLARRKNSTGVVQKEQHLSRRGNPLTIMVTNGL